MTHVWPAASGGGRACDRRAGAGADGDQHGRREGAAVRTAVFLAISKTIPLLVFIGVGVFAVIAAAARSPDRRRRGDGRRRRSCCCSPTPASRTRPAPAGEFKNPRRDVPFALIAQIVIVTADLHGRAVGGAWHAAERGEVADAAGRRRGALPGRVGRVADDGGRGPVDPRHQQQHRPSPGRGTCTPWPSTVSALAVSSAYLHPRFVAPPSRRSCSKSPSRCRWR